MSSQHTLFKGTVKEVLSGDSVVVCTPSTGGKPAERRLVMTGVVAPRIARRSGDKEEHYAYASREFLKELVGGKELLFKIAPNAAAVSYAIMYVDPADPVDVIATCLAAGMVKLRNRERSYPEDVALEDAAKDGELGMWGAKTPASTRNIKWAGSYKPKTLFAELKGKTVPAEVTFVRSGHAFRALLTDSWHQVSVSILGIRSAFIDRKTEVADPAAAAAAEAEADRKWTQLKDKAQIAGEDVSAVKRPRVHVRKETKETCAHPAGFVARSFTEMNLGGRVVNLTITDISPNGTFGAVVSLPDAKKDIALALVSRGLAKVDEYTVFRMPNAKQVRAAEAKAKAARSGLWSNYVAPEVGDAVTHEGQITEVPSGDSFVLSNADGNTRYFLASVRAPVLPRRDGTTAGEPGALVAKEALRKLLIGKNVTVVEQYSVTRDSHTRTFVTLDVRGDVSLQMITLGLAKVVKGSSEGSRHPEFLEMLEAEAMAQEAELGIFAKGGAAPNVLPTDLTRREMVEAAKTQGEALASRSTAVDARVEFVSSGSRVKVVFPGKNVAMNVMLAGVNAPRAPGRDGNGGEPLGAESRAFLRSRLNQRDVRVVVETSDKYGNLIAQVFGPDGTNMNVALLEVGLAAKSWNAERSPIAEELSAAVERAQASRLGMWKDFDPEAEARAAAAAQAREDAAAGPSGPATVTITACNTPVNYCIQFKSEDVEQRISALNARVAALGCDDLPALAAPFTYGQEVLALFEEDGQWYRAKVLKASPTNPVVQFVDYGNKEVVDAGNLRECPADLSVAEIPAFSFVVNIAFVGAPADQRWRDAAIGVVGEAHDDSNQSFKMTPVYTDAKGVRHAYLTTSEGEDVGLKLVEQGYALVATKTARDYPAASSYVAKLVAARDAARAEYKGQFCYGDVDELDE